MDYIARFFLAIGRVIGQILGAIARGAGEAILHALRQAGHALGRLIARLAGMAAAVFGFLWLIQNQPGVIAGLLQLAIVVGGFWIMIRAVFRRRPPRQGNDRRRR